MPLTITQNIGILLRAKEIELSQIVYAWIKMGFWISVGLAAYFAPTFVASEGKSFFRIALVNTLAGWTIVGWAISLYWALKSQDLKDNTSG